MKCSFCGNEIPKGKGIIYAKANGTVYYFCSSKCKKNFLKLRRQGRNVKWTKAFVEFKKSQAKKKAKKG